MFTYRVGHTTSPLYLPFFPLQTAWLLKAVSCIDLTTLAGDDTPSNVHRLCVKAIQPVRYDLLKKMDMQDKGLTCWSHHCDICYELCQWFWTCLGFWTPCISGLKSVDPLISFWQIWAFNFNFQSKGHKSAVAPLHIKTVSRKMSQKIMKPNRCSNFQI